MAVAAIGNGKCRDKIMVDAVIKNGK